MQMARGTTRGALALLHQHGSIQSREIHITGLGRNSRDKAIIHRRNGPVAKVSLARIQPGFP